MRKLCLIVLASLSCLPAAALAERVAAGDGSLVVANADGRLVVSGHGLIFGHLDRGSVTVVGDYKPDDHSALSSVSGAKMRVVGGKVVYTGTDMRFFFPGGKYVLVLDGLGIDVSAVGTGKLVAPGLGLAGDGTIAVDGGRPQAADTIEGAVLFGKGGGTGGGTGHDSDAGSGRGKHG
ncbi:MAG TPA: hypothetical protein VFB42_08335 [Gaiellaceae bacterium]|nr:hypothetical protein [Gaiellaceae bacterium]